MSVALVNGHVLLPHLPDWRTMVSFQRQWQTEVGRSIAGGEDRIAPRLRSRLRFGWSLIPTDVSDQAQMHARLRPAVRSGYAAVPFWGRGIAIAQAAGDTVVLSSDAWSFIREDDYLLLRTLDLTTPEDWEVVQVATIISGVEFNLAGDVAGNWNSGAYAWPLLFGAFTCNPLTHRSNWHTALQCSLRTLGVERLPLDDLCVILGTSAGDNFECYAIGEYASGQLDSGNGWAAGWLESFNPVGIVSQETFEDYLTGETDGTGLNAGTGWDTTENGWRFDGYEPPYIASQETFEDYDTGTVTAPLDSGEGWDTGEAGWQMDDAP